MRMSKIEIPSAKTDPALLEALEQERERRRIARGQPAEVKIVTGVPRDADSYTQLSDGQRRARFPNDDGNPESHKQRLAKALFEAKAPPPMPKPTPEPTIPTEWRYVRVQVEPPTDTYVGRVLE